MIHPPRGNQAGSEPSETRESTWRVRHLRGGAQGGGRRHLSVVIPILLDRVRQKLPPNQRHEQSGFTPEKSTVDRFLALRVLTERLRDFCIGLLAAYVDLRKTSDSVNRDVL